MARKARVTPVTLTNVTGHSDIRTSAECTHTASGAMPVFRWSTEPLWHQSPSAPSGGNGSDPIPSWTTRPNTPPPPVPDVPVFPCGHLAAVPQWTVPPLPAGPPSVPVSSPIEPAGGNKQDSQRRAALGALLLHGVTSVSHQPSRRWVARCSEGCSHFPELAQLQVTDQEPKSRGT